MRIPKIVLAIGLACPAASVVAAPPTNPSNTMARASDDSHDEVINTVTDEKVICRRDKAIGSRVNAKRICMTSREWAKKTAEERQYLELRQQQMQRAGN